MATTEMNSAEAWRKEYMLRVRMDEDTLAKLDYCCDKTGKSRSEVVRNAIVSSYRGLKRKEK